MKKCIICLKDKDDSKFNIEHIIPDSLGGNITIDMCCSECNSKLGMNVDSRLTNINYIEVVRWALRIKGRNGVPNPFRGKVNSPIEGIEGHLKFNKEGEFEKFQILTKPIVNSKDRYVMVADNIDNMVKNINKKISKHNQKPFTKEEIRENSYSISMPKPKNIKVQKLPKEYMKSYYLEMLPAILKIVYEFSCKALGYKYVENDITGNDIRKILYDASYQLRDKADIPTDCNFEDLELDNIKRYNSINLSVQENIIFCNINILGFIKGKVVVSEQADQYEKIDMSIYEVSF